MFNFWNGNKSKKRQGYEFELLKKLLDLESNVPILVNNDCTDFPRAEDEGNIFKKNYDALVTVAGNTKFSNKSAIKLHSPVCKGLLGHRILIIRKQDHAKFHRIDNEHLKSLISGVPATWADADLFRSNGYRVLEQGTLPEILQLLSNKACDYVSLGANEVESIFLEHAEAMEDLIIEQSIVLYYPLPLVFYVHPEKQQLARLLDNNLQCYIESGQFNLLFNQHFGSIVDSIGIDRRRFIHLSNPELPLELKSFHSQFAS